MKRDFCTLDKCAKGTGTLLRSKTFREDLFFRLNVLKLEIPPLRDRPEDIKVIAEKLIKLHSDKMGKQFILSNGAVKLLQSYPWPGNVRELENVIQRLVVTCRSYIIGPSEVWETLDGWKTVFGKNVFREDEMHRMIDALRETRGCKARAAKLLGIHGTTLWRRMRKYRMTF
ncbi:MAG: helix-turn-helix domain-containing protein [Candidatus Bathyarchaeia archaeon]